MGKENAEISLWISVLREESAVSPGMVLFPVQEIKKFLRNPHCGKCGRNRVLMVK